MDRNESHVITSRVWEWEGKGSWHFATINKTDAERIRADYIWPRKGFGSIPVTVTIGVTTWKTSIFPTKEKEFLLPLKRVVRESENIKIGNTIRIELFVRS